MTPDVNVLVAAFRADHPHHRVARDWLEGALDGAQSGAVFTVMPMVLASLLRLVTSPKIFVTPTPMAEAVAFVDALLALPGVQLGTLGPEWPRLTALCTAKALSGNDVPDAWLAAAVEQAGEHLVSFDRDFRKLLPRGRFTLLEAGPR
ncbi:TA system VapC family ribonuclease toxin [Roseateles sp.]|uniref:TA system VapC family ribonuclease toxin n=1 Tax=Roseateles sp. TaxID=1971397 RepID=UPI002DFE91D9|nr:TA system VapC family ribonuclease toxin [Roseateles sp.]